jgi:phage shock protein C
MSNVKRLYRSEKERMIGGVAGGLAEYFNIDPTLVRIGFVVATIFWGTGVLVYLAMWLIVPSQSNLSKAGSEALNHNVEEIKKSAQQAGEFVKNKIEEVQKPE